MMIYPGIMKAAWAWEKKEISGNNSTKYYKVQSAEYGVRCAKVHSTEFKFQSVGE